MNTTTQECAGAADGGDAAFARLMKHVHDVCQDGSLGVICRVTSQSIHPDGVVEVNIEEPSVVPDPFWVYSQIRARLTPDMTRVGRTLNLRFCTDKVALHRRSFVRDICFILLAIFAAIATGVWMKHGN